MTKQKQPFVHTDAFGTPVNVGDIVLGAKAKHNNYTDTEYMFSIVTEKTPKLLRLHQLGVTPSVLNTSPDNILKKHLQYRGRKGGRCNSSCVIHTGRSTNLTKEQMDAYIFKSVDDTTNVLSFP